MNIAIFFLVRVWKLYVFHINRVHRFFFGGKLTDVFVCFEQESDRQYIQLNKLSEWCEEDITQVDWILLRDAPYSIRRFIHVIRKQGEWEDRDPCAVIALYQDGGFFSAKALRLVRIDLADMLTEITGDKS